MDTATVTTGNWHAISFESLFQALQRQPLSGAQAASLQAWLSTLLSGDYCFRLIEQAGIGRTCPRCGGARYHRRGHANGLQRFQCLACRRTFNALTGTPLARLRQREKWLPYLQCLIESRTVRAAARQVDVARSTSFRWRHRFITGVRRARPARLAGVVEADETFVLESQKGSRHLDRPARRRGGKARYRGISRDLDCVLVARDRGRTTHAFVTGRGPVSVSQLETYLQPVLRADVLLVSDAARAYQAFARAAGISHAFINLRAGIRARGAIHLQNVNGWHSRLKTWMRRFNGVASRYLSNYVDWQRVLDANVWTGPPDWLHVAVAGHGKRD